MNSCQRSALILGVVMVFTLVKWDSFVSAQDKHDILRGLEECHVAVAPLKPEIEEDGLTRKPLLTETEQKFMKAGIKVLSRKEAVQVKGRPHFYLTAHVLKLPSGCYIYKVSTEFVEDVLPFRKPHVLIRAAAWTQPDILGFSCELSNISKTVQHMVDEFIDAYLSVSPK